MMGPELILFVMVAFIAIFAAVMMLVSENAVHSALFLILNFASVAFLYLMLNASFLAMVQVTVYAGAIMVLFLFVIMLLGAEKLLPESQPRFSWLTPLSVGLITALLLVASLAILQSDIEATQPEPHSPLLRVVHANSNLGLLDLYIDGEKVADNLEFAEATHYQSWATGDRTIQLFDQNGDPATSAPLLETTITLRGNDVISLIAMPEPVDGQNFLRVDGNLNPVKDRNASTFTAVNALTCNANTSCAVDIADRTDSGKNPFPIIENLAYGEISSTQILRRDQYNSRSYTLNAYNAGDVETAIAAVAGANVKLDPLATLRDYEIKDNESLLWLITGDTRAQFIRIRGTLFADANRPTFGSAEAVGLSLFTKYLLPFEVIAVLLLAAMVGTIILTNQDSPQTRRRQIRRMAAVPGAPTVEEYVHAMKQGEALPAPTPAKQLPESTKGSGD